MVMAYCKWEDIIAALHIAVFAAFALGYGVCWLTCNKEKILGRFHGKRTNE